ncbi:MAG: DUF1559 domain-containing protein [Planctomycetota bacterium]
MILISLLLPAVQQCREAARRTQCQNNLMQLGIAFANYQQVYFMLPPGCVSRTAVAGPSEELFRLSWIAQLLPYIDQQGMYRQINFSRPEFSFLTAEEIERRKEVLQIQAELKKLREEQADGAGPAKATGVDSAEGQARPDDGTEPPAAAGSELVMAGRLTELEARLQQLGFAADEDFYTKTVQHLATLDPHQSYLKCPSSPNRGASYGGAHHSVEMPLSDQADGLLFVNSSESLASIPDGSSQTILVGEHVALFSALQSSAWLFGGAGSLRNGDQMTSSAEKSAASQRATRDGLVADFSGSSSDERLQFIQGLSSLGPFGSYHSFDQVQFLFADGSVRAVSRLMDAQQLARMINRHDGF